MLVHQRVFQPVAIAISCPHPLPDSCWTGAIFLGPRAASPPQWRLSGLQRPCPRDSQDCLQSDFLNRSFIRSFWSALHDPFIIHSLSIHYPFMIHWLSTFWCILFMGVGIKKTAFCSESWPSRCRTVKPKVKWIQGDHRRSVMTVAIKVTVPSGKLT